MFRRWLRFAVVDLWRWLVLWPLWSRMAWPRSRQIGAAVGTGIAWLVVIIAVSAATGPKEEEKAQAALSPTPTRFPTVATVTRTPPAYCYASDYGHLGHNAYSATSDDGYAYARADA